MECLLIHQANYVISTMMEEFELGTSDFRVVDDPTWQMFGEVATVLTNRRGRASDKANNMLSECKPIVRPRHEVDSGKHTRQSCYDHGIML